MANNSVTYRFGTMKYLFIMLAGIAGIVSGCSEKKTFTDPESVLILSGRVALEGMPETPDAKAEPVRSEPLPATDLGVYVLTVSGDTPTDFETTSWKNEAFVSDAGGNIGGGSVTLRTGTVYDIYAYAPRSEGAGDAHRIPVRHGEDILWACTPGVVATAGGTKARLEFRHCGAQIGFRLKASDGSDLSGAKLEVGGFYRDGTLDAETGKLSVAGASFRTTAAPDGTKTNILISGGSMDFAVTVTDVPGRSGTFTGSFSRTLQAGKSYLYDVTVNMDGAPITFTGQVEDWVDVEASGPLPVE